MDPRELVKNFKIAMAQIPEEELFTEAGYHKVMDAMQFLPPQMREGFLAQFVLVATQM